MDIQHELSHALPELFHEPSLILQTVGHVLCDVYFLFSPLELGLGSLGDESSWGYSVL